MIARILPASVVADESFGSQDELARLHPEEEAVVASAVEKRRREFAAVRACARRAMVRLGAEPIPLLPGPHRAPQWPAGLVGSLTHCDGYRAAAVAYDSNIVSVGIDAEPHAPLPEEAAEAIMWPAEREQVRKLASWCPDIHADRLIFSAKESVYKAWFPLTGRWLGFEDATVDITVDRAGGAIGCFRAELLVPGPRVAGEQIRSFEGMWLVQQQILTTAVTISRGPAPGLPQLDENRSELHRL